MKVKCPKCNGKGWDGYITIKFTNCRNGPPVQDFKSKRFCKRFCNLCDRTGSVDWVTRITRKEDNTIPF